MVKCAGARSAGNPHAACDVAGVGNGATDDSTWARRRKLRIQTRAILVGYRASARPYQACYFIFYQTEIIKAGCRVIKENLETGKQSCAQILSISSECKSDKAEAAKASLDINRSNGPRTRGPPLLLSLGTYKLHLPPVELQRIVVSIPGISSRDALV